MRIYDPRVGRFLSVDPLSGEYPWNSTYAFAENKVIRYVDLDGLEVGEPGNNSYRGAMLLMARDAKDAEAIQKRYEAENAATARKIGYAPLAIIGGCDNRNFWIFYNS
jgi:hypothetical protein